MPQTYPGTPQAAKKPRLTGRGRFAAYTGDACLQIFSYFVFNDRTLARSTSEFGIVTFIG